MPERSPTIHWHATLRAGHSKHSGLPVLSASLFHRQTSLLPDIQPVNILNPQQNPPPHLPGQNPIHQKRPRIPQMQRPRRRRRQSCNLRLRHASFVTRVFNPCKRRPRKKSSTDFKDFHRLRNPPFCIPQSVKICVICGSTLLPRSSFVSSCLRGNSIRSSAPQWLYLTFSCLRPLRLRGEPR